jgi:hypothetical protein
MKSLADFSDDQQPKVQRQKLQAVAWSLLDYQRVVLLSPSQIVLKNIDQLMEMATENYGNVLACLASLACTCTGGPIIAVQLFHRQPFFLAPRPFLTSAFPYLL